MTLPKLSHAEDQLDRPITLDELRFLAAEHLGREPFSRSAVRQWKSRGVHGVKLETFLTLTRVTTTFRKFLDFKAKAEKAREEFLQHQSKVLRGRVKKRLAGDEEERDWKKRQQAAQKELEERGLR